MVGRARLRETLKQSKQMCRGFETFRHPSLRWHLAVIFKYCSETTSTKKQLSELTNYNVCYVSQSTKWFGGVVSVLDWNAGSLWLEIHQATMSYFYLLFTYKDFYLKILSVLLLMDLAYFFFFFLHRISPAFEKILSQKPTKWSCVNSTFILCGS